MNKVTLLSTGSALLAQIVPEYDPNKASLLSTESSTSSNPWMIPVSLLALVLVLAAFVVLLKKRKHKRR